MARGRSWRAYGVAVALGDGVAVALGVGVAVALGVGVAVAVGVAVVVEDGVAVGDGVAVAVSVSPSSSSAEPPAPGLKVMLTVLGWVITTVHVLPEPLHAPPHVLTAPNSPVAVIVTLVP